jgi:hypothetical protein
MRALLSSVATDRELLTTGLASNTLPISHTDAQYLSRVRASSGPRAVAKKLFHLLTSQILLARCLYYTSLTEYHTKSLG